MADRNYTEDGQNRDETGKTLEERSGISTTSQCAVCHNYFSKNDLVDIDGNLVCSECKPQMLRKMQEGVADTAYYHYAGFWIRVVAYIVDGIILWIIQFPIGMFFAFIIGSSMENMNPNTAFTITIPLQILNMLLSIIIPCLYSVIFIVKKGATPGKMAVGIKVINADGTEKISVGKAIGRYFAKILSGLIFCIGYLMIAFDEQKRGLHDRICKTLVVYKK